MVVVAILGFTKGNPDLVLYPYEEDGRPCGTGDQADYPYLYFYGAVGSSNILTCNTFCVKKCPTTWSEKIECLPTKNSPDCKISIVQQYLSFVFVERACLPDLDLYKTYTKEAYTAAGLTDQDFNNQQKVLDFLENDWIKNSESLVNYMSDLITTKWVLLGSLGVAVVISFIYLILIKLLAGIIVYGVILVVIAGFALLGYMLQNRADFFKTDSIDLSDQESTLEVLAYISYALSGVILLYFLFMCDRIRLAIGLVKASATLFFAVITLFLVPIFNYLLTALFYAYWIVVSMFLLNKIHLLSW